MPQNCNPPKKSAKKVAKNLSFLLFFFVPPISKERELIRGLLLHNMWRRKGGGKNEALNLFVKNGLGRAVQILKASFFFANDLLSEDERDGEELTPSNYFNSPKVKVLSPLRLVSFFRTEKVKE